jgi:hypothetical protein
MSPDVASIAPVAATTSGRMAHISGTHAVCRCGPMSDASYSACRARAPPVGQEVTLAVGEHDGRADEFGLPLAGMHVVLGSVERCPQHIRLTLRTIAESGREGGSLREETRRGGPPSAAPTSIPEAGRAARGAPERRRVRNQTHRVWPFGGRAGLPRSRRSGRCPHPPRVTECSSFPPVECSRRLASARSGGPSERRVTSHNVV